MSIKKFTAEGRFECGLDKLVEGKPYAFISVVGKNEPWELGVAIADEPGYNPVPTYWCHATEGTDQKAFDAHVGELNRAIGLERHEEVAIIVSTMGGRSYKASMAAITKTRSVVQDG